MFLTYRTTNKQIRFYFILEDTLTIIWDILFYENLYKDQLRLQLLPITTD